MITFERGDLLLADVDALVNPVNCVGKMGRGLALQFRAAFPDNFKAYAAACAAGQVCLGAMFIHHTGRRPVYIINFPTKQHWRDASHLTDIEIGLGDLADVIRAFRIRSIAVPALGCGLGGLDWDDVRPMIIAALQPIEGLRAIIFEPREVRA